MPRWDEGKLTDHQAVLVRAWFDSPTLVEDLSWGLVDTKVLRVRPGGQGNAERDVIIKAAGPDNHHISREITAHEGYTTPLVTRGRTGRMLHSDRGASILAIEYLEGTLVGGTPTEWQATTYTQAGELLQLLHHQLHRVDTGFEAHATAVALARLDGSQRIEPTAARTCRHILTSYRPQPIDVVPTHGDWQPRNWLTQDGTVLVIDFGRFALRPAATDLIWLAEQQWRGRRELEAAFFSGYGTDPRTADVWPVMLLREAINTAVWAYQVGDFAFEAAGHRRITEALARM